MGSAIVDVAGFIGLIVLGVTMFAATNATTAFYSLAVYILTASLANIVYGYVIDQVVDGYVCSAGIAAFAAGAWFMGWLEATPPPRREQHFFS